MLYEATIRGMGVSVEADGVGAPAVVLEAREEIVPIFVDPGQARTIERARRGVPTGRPMTHDLFVGVLDDIGVAADRVRIDDLEDGTFHAKLDLTLQRGDARRELVRDARPSDGIALAVRVDCPVLIAGEVIDEAGRPPESVAEEPRSGPGAGSGGSGPGAGSRAPGPGAYGGREGEEADPIDLDPREAVDIDIEDAGGGPESEGVDESDPGEQGPEPRGGDDENGDGNESEGENENENENESDEAGNGGDAGPDRDG